MQCLNLFWVGKQWFGEWSTYRTYLTFEILGGKDINGNSSQTLSYRQVPDTFVRRSVCNNALVLHHNPVGLAPELSRSENREKSGCTEIQFIQERALDKLQSRCSVYEPELLNLAFCGERKGTLIGSAQEMAHGGSGFSSHYEKKWLLLAAADRKPLFPKGSTAVREEAQQRQHQHLRAPQDLGKSS